MYYKINNIVYKKIDEFEFLGETLVFLETKEKLLSTYPGCFDCPKRNQCDDHHTCVSKEELEEYKISKLEGLLRHGI